MSVLIRFAPASLTADQYDESVRWLTDAGDFPPDGLDYHVCFGSSREQLEAFGQRLMPVLAEIGIDPGEPERLEIHNIVKRSARDAHRLASAGQPVCVTASSRECRFRASAAP